MGSSNVGQLTAGPGATISILLYISQWDLVRQLPASFAFYLLRSIDYRVLNPLFTEWMTLNTLSRKRVQDKDIYLNWEIIFWTLTTSIEGSVWKSALIYLPTDSKKPFKLSSSRMSSVTFAISSLLKFWGGTRIDEHSLRVLRPLVSRACTKHFIW